MKTFVALWLFVLLSFGLAQTYQELEKTAHEQYQAGNYHQALELYLRLLPLKETALGKENANVAATLSTLGFIYHQIRRYDLSLEFYKKALLIREKVLGFTHLDTARAYEGVGSAYGNLGNHAKALEQFVKALATYEVIRGTESAENLPIYNSIGYAYSMLNNYPKALEFYLKTLAIRERFFGVQQIDNASYSSTISLAYERLGNVPKALEFAIKTLSIREAVLGVEHKDTAWSYSKVGVLHARLGDHSKALEVFMKALIYGERVLGLNHPDTARSYFNVGVSYFQLRDYPKALEFHLKALAVRERVLGVDHLDTALSYQVVGGSYSQQGIYSKALEFHLKALLIREKNLGVENQLTARSYNEVGGSYLNLGDFSKALEFFRKELAITEKILGIEHIDTARSYNDVGAVYERLGDLPKAQEFLTKAFTIRERLLGVEDQSTAASYNNIGAIYIKLGDYSNALKTFTKALNIREKLLGTEHLSVASSHMNLALVYNRQGEFTKALQHGVRALTITEKTLGVEHLDTAKSYHTVGSSYWHLGDFSKALEYLTKALSITEKLLGIDNIETASIYSSIGLVYDGLRDSRRAIEFTLKAATIFERVLGVENPSTGEAYNTLGVLYGATKDFQKSLEFFRKSIAVVASFQSQAFTITDFRSKTHFNNTIRRFFRNQILLFREMYREKWPSSNSDVLSVLNNWVNYKGSSFDLENSIRRLRDTIPTLIPVLDEYEATRRQLAALFTIEPKDDKEATTTKQALENVKKKQSELEVTISRQSSSFAQAISQRSISISELQDQLKADELYLDFVWLPDNLMVFTLDRTGNVGLHFLADPREVAALITQFRNALQENKPSAEVAGLAAQLYQMLFKSLSTPLPNYKSLLISPDGPLNFIPFDLLNNNGKLLLETHIIRSTPTARDFLRIQRTANATKNGPVVFGNPNFSGVPEQAAAGNRGGEVDFVSRLLSREIFGPLPYTAEEAQSVAKMLDCQGDSCLFLDRRANESNLMAVRSPRVLHLATHGFFIKGGDLPNPLLRVGIALTGARSGVTSGEGTGIVTGLQLSTLELQGTELVVLSACETGLGDSVDGEGVAGLSQALILAGAKQVMLSLWRVQDKETALLMNAFYRRYTKGMEAAQALREAKLELMKQGLNPYYWGAFVLNGR